MRSAESLRRCYRLESSVSRILPLAGMFLFEAAAAQANTVPVAHQDSLFVPVPGATFTMGDKFHARPPHAVELIRGFQIARHETTNAEYCAALQWAFDHDRVRVEDRCVYDAASGDILIELEGPFGELGLAAPGRFQVVRSPAPWIKETNNEYRPEVHPVQGVSWYGAAAYCNWRSEMEGLQPPYDSARQWRCRGGTPYTPRCYRLPTEAEWELAARGLDGRLMPWGDGAMGPAGRENWSEYAANVRATWTRPVGATSPDADSPYGVSDMMGNVWEWVFDRNAPYLDTKVTNPAGPEHGNDRIIRGSSYESGVAWMMTATCRAYHPASSRSRDVGFRIARTLSR